MSRIPIKELRQMGVAQEDIELAKQTQAAQRRNGSPIQSIGVIVGAVEPRKKHNPNPPTSLTDRAMRKRGTYDQAALLLDQQALQERSNGYENVEVIERERKFSVLATLFSLSVCGYGGAGAAFFLTGSLLGAVAGAFGGIAVWMMAMFILLTD